MDSWAQKYLDEITAAQAQRARVTKVQWRDGAMFHGWERLNRPLETWEQQQVPGRSPLWTTVRIWQHRKLARAIYLPAVSDG